MAREFFLFCSTCKEFMDLHKFRILPLERIEPPLGINGITISPDEIEEGIKNSGIHQKNMPDSYIFDLLPFIYKFSKEHASHELRIGDDYGTDYHWWPEHPGYTEWKETISSLTHELFLPRNLVDDLKITDWEAAEIHLKSLQVVLYDELELDEYRLKFKELTEQTH